MNMIPSIQFVVAIGKLNKAFDWWKEVLCTAMSTNRQLDIFLQKMYSIRVKIPEYEINIHV